VTARKRWHNTLIGVIKARHNQRHGKLAASVISAAWHRENESIKA